MPSAYGIYDVYNVRTICGIRYFFLFRCKSIRITFFLLFFLPWNLHLIWGETNKINAFNAALSIEITLELRSEIRIISLFLFWHFSFSLPKQNTEFDQFLNHFDEGGKKLKRNGWSFEVNKNSTNDIKSNWIIRILNIKTVFLPVSSYLYFVWSCFFFHGFESKRKRNG